MGSNRQPRGAAAHDSMPLAAAAAAARARILHSRWATCARRSAAPTFAASVLGIVIVRLSGTATIEWPGVIIAVLAWVGATYAVARATLPSAAHALALWDEKTGRHEFLLSAWAFEREDGSLGVGSLLHLQRARYAAAEHLSHLPADYPCAPGHRSWALPAVLIAVSASGILLRPPLPEDVRVTAAHALRAKELAEALSQDADAPKTMEGLSAAEQEKLDDVHRQVKDTVEKLKTLSDATPKDVLEDLERRARAAEQLASQLTPTDEQILPAEVLDELSRHADTAPFAGAVEAGDFEKISAEAKRLADKLDASPTVEERERLKHALDKSLAEHPAGEPSATAQNLKEADRQLAKKRLAEASEQFRQIQSRFQKAAERKRSRRQLERLADRLRSTGQKIFRPSTGAMARLTPSPYASPPRLAPPPPAGTGSKQCSSQSMRMRLAQMSAAQGSLAPGGAMQRSAQVTPLQAQGQMQAPPIPGAGGLGSPGSSAIPGGGQIPGGSLGAMASPQAGAAAGPPSAQASAGGNSAGQGTAPLAGAASSPTKASTTSVVNAPLGREGASSTRRLEGVSHEDESTRASTAVALAFVSAQEEALDAEPLPLSRREEVLRYFTGLRKQLEETGDQQ
jgi:hypothetical protein